MNKYNIDGFEACTHVAMQYMVSAAGLKAILEAYEAAKAPERETGTPKYIPACKCAQKWDGKSIYRVCRFCQDGQLYKIEGGEP